MPQDTMSLVRPPKPPSRERQEVSSESTAVGSEHFQSLLLKKSLSETSDLLSDLKSRMSRKPCKTRRFVNIVGRLWGVTPKESTNGYPECYLVCGQGRYEAYQLLGEPEIPSMIVHVTKEDLLLLRDGAHLRSRAV